jgi:hypothetical protein
MSTESDSSTIPEAYLPKAKQLLDEENVDESSRALFFSALQSYLAGNSPSTPSFPPENVPVWVKVLNLVKKYIAKTPTSPPRTPKSADTPLSPPSPSGRHRAGERIGELIRLSPRQSFQERVLGSPVKGSPKAEEVTEAEVGSLSLDKIDPTEQRVEVELTEQDYRLLQRLKDLRAAQAKAIPEKKTETFESSEFKIDEVISLSDDE